MSFGILRTNVGLTTNIKIMVNSNYSLSLDSIDSIDRLSLNRFKNFKFNNSTLYDELIPIFYKNIPSETSFHIKYNDDSQTMGNSFNEQYDDLYNYGSRSILNNKDYKEEFEYFAPLYIDGDLPKNFVIFRVDGPGIESISKENFIDSLVNNFKVVKLFDLTDNSNLGKWLSLNFTENEYFPKSPLDIDFRSLEFSRWNGIDYETGGYTSKSMFMDDILEDEKEIFELEKFIFSNFKNKKVVFPNILNLSFLFDDTPSTPEINRKWSLNRYYGFYLDDIELLYTISPYNPPKLRDDVVILENNLIFSEDSPNNPFEEEWTNDKPFYVEHEGEYYLVERYTEPRGDKIMKIPYEEFIGEDYQTVIVNFYRIISSVNLEGKQNEINKNYGVIKDDSLIVDEYNNFSIPDFDDADIWIIEIDDIYHKLIKENDLIKINSDYEFIFNENTYEYKVGSISKSVSIIVDFNNPPKKLNIYKCKLTDIKDFDTKIIDTEYSKFEYEKKDELTLTDETKMYLDDLSTNTNPKGVDDFIYKDSVVNIPVSSEYTANFETFKVNNNGLSDIWRINPVYCRWVFKNSLSSNDYPYPLNNSNVFELFNRTTNIFETEPDRSERNLDYFYTINSSTSSYIHHSLHVEKVDNGQIDLNYQFDEQKYLNIGYNFDYFSYFFERKNEFDSSNIKKNVKKYSIFNESDLSTPNLTLFRGIEFRMYDVESVTLTQEGDIENVNLLNSNEFDNYKFSILLDDDDNGMEWDIIDDWKMGKDYASGSIALFEDILYKATTDIKVDSPVESINNIDVKSAPYNTGWTYSNPTASIFWSPTKSYIKYDFVYNFGDYYYVSNISNTNDFWNPIIQGSGGYPLNSIVLFKGEYYQSMTSSNIYPPDFMLNKTPSREFQQFEGDITASEDILSVVSSISKKLPVYWNKIEKPQTTKWNKIELWNPSLFYTILPGDSKLVIHNDIIWITTQSINVGMEPGVSPEWTRRYSIVADTNYIYTQINNPIIQLNNRFYLMKNNPLNNKLDNGILIYINKRWKNILINIKFNDNTLPNLSNTDRDDLYDDLYKSITAYNFVSSINEFYKKHGFANYLKYIIIDEDGSINQYQFDDNIKDLPYLIGAYPPDEFNVRFSSLSRFSSNRFSSRINVKPTKVLSNGNIDDISKLNWYNNIPIAYSIQENSFEESVVKNYSGLRNTTTSIFRFTGPYMPLFYEIQLFDKNTENRLPGNYKFDTSLTDFGLFKERKLRKINRKGSILKLKNLKGSVSMYPMIDEFGYTFTDFMVFKSTWDVNYHIETVNNKIFIKNFEEKVEVPASIGQSKIVKIQNLKKYNL